MLIKRLLRPDEHARFISFNQENTGSPVEATYLDKANVWIFSRPATPDEWVAAYAVNTRAEFRCLSVISPDQRTQALDQHGLSEDRLVELTLLSRNRALGWLPGERDYYYRMGFLDALKMGKRHLLGGTTDPDLLGFQQQLLDRVLFEGDLSFFGHNKYGWLIYTSWFGAIGNAILFSARQVWASLSSKRRPDTRRPMANG